jgi:epoxyqueuosine reductase QueG
MDNSSHGLSQEIADSIRQLVVDAETETEYRRPLIAFAAADHPRFVELQRLVHPSRMLPHELLPGARSVVSFFLPFAAWVVEAHARERSQVAREWAVAHGETNALLVLL